MTGYTFKVGDWVECSGERSDVNGTVRLLAWPPDSCDEVPVQSPSGTYYIASVHDLRPLPLFDPVEVWVEVIARKPVISRGGYVTAFVDQPTVAGHGDWVKVVITPAEDQS